MHVQQKKKNKYFFQKFALFLNYDFFNKLIIKNISKIMGFFSSLIDHLKSLFSWAWTYLWILWFILVVILFYILKGPLKLTENVSMATMFFNTLTPKFYVALTGTSSLISGLILIFEWWYFKKYGTSFIEQVSLNYISSGSESAMSQTDSSSSNGSNHPNESVQDKALRYDNDSNQCMNSTSSSLNATNSVNLSTNNSTFNAIPECKVWKNPMSLLRGSEYSKLTEANGKDPLTFYDMNLSAQDHQTFFTCEYDDGKPDFEIMQRAWRERNPSTRISLANEAIKMNPE